MKLLLILILIAGGYFFYHYHQKEISQTISDASSATKNAGDAGIQSALAGVGKISPLYYIQNNRSYGASAAKNLCFDSNSSNSLGSIIADIQSVAKSVSCTVDSDFPSRSFTITVPSFANTGQYFCTDQSGIVGLIPSIEKDSSFKQGIKCK